MLSPWSWVAAGDVCLSSSAGQDTGACLCVPIGATATPFSRANTHPPAPVQRRQSPRPAPRPCVDGAVGQRHRPVQPAPGTAPSLGTDPSCRHAVIQALMAARNWVQSSAVPAAAGSSARRSACSRPSCPLRPVIAATYSTTRCGCTIPGADGGVRDGGDHPGRVWPWPPWPQGVWLPVRSGSQAAKVQSRANSSEQPLSAGAEGGTWVMEGPGASPPAPSLMVPTPGRRTTAPGAQGPSAAIAFGGAPVSPLPRGTAGGRGFLRGPGGVVGLRGSRWGGRESPHGGE